MGKRLAVIFPGIGYHCDKPILYYSRKLAKEQEYKEIISLEYSYTEKNIRGNEKRMKEVFDVLYQILPSFFSHFLEYFFQCKNTLMR